MKPTKIEWTDYTLNPIKGKCKLGCPYCYARRMYERFKWKSEVKYVPEVFRELDNLKKPSGIFLCSTHELFGDWIPYDWIADILARVAQYPQHRFYILTKCPERASKRIFYFPQNVWLGVTAETTEKAIDRIKHLLKVDVNVRFISIEPIMGAVEIPQGLDWIIVGQETGNRKGKIVPEREWIERIAHFARLGGTPIFLKNNLKNIWGDNLMQEFPKGGLGADG